MRSAVTLFQQAKAKVLGAAVDSASVCEDSDLATDTKIKELEPTYEYLSVTHKQKTQTIKLDIQHPEAFLNNLCNLKAKDAAKALRRNKSTLPAIRKLRAEQPDNMALYVCYVLMTSDIKKIKLTKLTEAMVYLKTQGFSEKLINSLELMSYGLNTEDYLPEKLAKALRDGDAADAFLNLAGMDLSGFNLEKANLSYANLVGANLHSANLTGAILRNANLKNANLVKAVTKSADFREVNLCGATLNPFIKEGLNLNGAIIIDKRKKFDPDSLAEKLDNLFRLNVTPMIIWNNVQKNLKGMKYSLEEQLALLPVVSGHACFNSKNDHYFLWNDNSEVEACQKMINDCLERVSASYLRSQCQ